MTLQKQKEDDKKSRSELFCPNFLSGFVKK